MSVDRSRPVQATWPGLTCYGCGPANEHGLRLESYLSDDGTALVATYEADERYNSGAPNVAYGGLLASLVDCHSLWTAATLGTPDDADGSPGDVQFVTAALSVEYLRPTPLDEPIELSATVARQAGTRTTVDCEVRSGGERTARTEVTAVRLANRD